MQSNISCSLLAHDPKASSVIGLQQANLEEQAFGAVDQSADLVVMVHRQALEESLTRRCSEEPLHAVGAFDRWELEQNLMPTAGTHTVLS